MIERNITDALIAMPIGDRAQAEAFISALQAAGLMHHFDDGAVDCLHGNGLVDLPTAVAIDECVARCYVAWEQSGADMHNDCPIGYALQIMGE
jgi:hypothetical protein